MGTFGLPTKCKHGILVVLFAAILSGGLMVFPDTLHAQSSQRALNAVNPEIGPGADNGSTGTAVGGKAPSGDVDEPSGITGFFYSLCLGLGGWFLWVGGNLLNYAVNSLVVGMGSLLEQGIGQAVDALWIVIRDICNIAFIFGIIYIGFRTILNSGDSNTQRMLISIIAAALLINFSLYFAQVIIDFTNVAAHQIYKLLDLGEGAGVADAFLQYSEIQTYGHQQQGILQNAAADEGNIPSILILGYGFMMMIFMLITAFVFIAGAILLVARFVVLIIFMIFSPFLVVGFAIPGFAGESKKYIKQFFSSAFVAPAFIFMLYLSATVLEKLQVGGSFALALRAGSSINGAFMIIIYFCVMIAFLIASLIVAKKMGVAGANQVVSIGNSMQKSARSYAGRAAGTATFGTLGSLGRNTVGRWQQNKADSDDLKERASRRGVAGFMARRQLDVARAVGSASFDARAVGGVGKKIGLGTGKKGGYKAARDAKADQAKKYADSLGEVGDDDVEVQILNGAVADTETEIQKLKRAKALETDPVKKEDIQIKIEEREKELANRKEAVKNEKARRQIGSESMVLPRDEERYAQAKQKHQFATGSLEVLRANFRKTTDETERRKLAEKIKETKEQISRHEAEMHEYTDGYAGVVENSSWYTNLFTGRNKSMNRKAGETIRETYKKKAKKTEEDKRFDSLGEKLDKASKKSGE